MPLDQETKDYIDSKTDLLGIAIILLAILVNKMSSPNTSGHNAYDPGLPQPITGTTGQAITTTAGGFIAVYESAPNVFKLCDGTEGNVTLFAGLAASGNYTNGANITVYPPGYPAAQPSTPYASGEYYAKKDGTLVSTLAAAVDVQPTATSWSLVVLHVSTARTVVWRGDIEQRVV